MIKELPKKVKEMRSLAVSYQLNAIKYVAHVMIRSSKFLGGR